MNYDVWLPMVGLPSDEPKLADALNKAGIANPIKIGADEISEIAEIQATGMVLEFTDESVVDPDDGLVGRAVLTGVTMHVHNPKTPTRYTGMLPFGLAADMSRDAVRALLGTPVESEDDFRWDQFEREGFGVNVSFAKGYQSIRSISLNALESTLMRLRAAR
jgi:hypothetical protein